MFSIIICSYNPNKIIFDRLLTSVERFNIVTIDHEIIIVDNNSSPALKDLEIVNKLTFAKSNFKILKEIKPGLTNARIAGIKEAKYNWIIFFDDDNEPSHDYLIQASKFIIANSNIGICGPGKVNVEFFSKKKLLETKRIQKLFQYKSVTTSCISNDMFNGDVDAFPYGTGMIIKKEILLEYCNQIDNRVYTMSDRTGNSLSSAGDTQILYTAIKMGFYAGTNPLIKLNHLIIETKTKYIAILKLLFSLNICQIKAFNEVFPENAIVVKKVSNRECFGMLYIKLKLAFKRKSGFNSALFDIAESFGMLKARIIAGNFETPILIRILEKIINV